MGLVTVTNITTKRDGKYMTRVYQGNFTGSETTAQITIADKVIIFPDFSSVNCSDQIYETQSPISGLLQITGGTLGIARNGSTNAAKFFLRTMGY